MIAELALPRLGETMESGRVVAWLKQPGEQFCRGETLLEVESDKTVVEMPALSDGTLLEILVPAGQDADVGAALCRYEDGAAETVPPIAPAVVAPAVVAPAPIDPVMAAPRPVATSRPRATPLARSLARRHEVDLDRLTGTGRRGRIEAVDVRDAGRGRDGTLALPEISVPGGRMAYRQWGADTGGGTFVLLHGLAGDWQTWSGLAAILTRGGARVIAPDLPGHGRTTVEAEGFDSLVEASVAFLPDVASAPVHLVGHSLGGAVAALVARAEPRLVARLTLLAPAGLDRVIDTDFVRHVARVRNGGALGHLLRRLSRRPHGLSTAQLDDLASVLAAGRLHALSDALVDAGGQCIDITADLRALPMPARLIWGLEDRIIPWTQVVNAGSRVGIHLIAGAGHVPHWDEPNEVASLLA